MGTKSFQGVLGVFQSNNQCATKKKDAVFAHAENSKLAIPWCPGYLDLVFLESSKNRLGRPSRDLKIILPCPYSSQKLLNTRAFWCTHRVVFDPLVILMLISLPLE